MTLDDFDLEFRKECELAINLAVEDAVTHGVGFVTIDRGLNFKYVTLEEAQEQIDYIKKYKVKKNES